MGNPTGEESFLLETVKLVRDREGNYWVTQDRNVKVFGPDGRFLKVVGRPGKGPMEWGRPNIIAPPPGADAIHVIDNVNQRQTALGKDLSLLSEGPLPPLEVIQAIALGNDKYFVNGWATSIESVGQPLHVLHGRDIVRSFGMTATSTAGLITPFTARRVIAADGRGLFFSTPYYSFDLEVWTEEGERVLGLSGPQLNAQLPVSGKRLDKDNPIPVQIQSMDVDEAGRLWIVSWHPKPDWFEHFEDQVQPDGRRMSVPKKNTTAVDVYTTYIEVIDPGSRAIVARLQQPGVLYGWASRGFLWENRINGDKVDITIWRVSAGE